MRPFSILALQLAMLAKDIYDNGKSQATMNIVFAYAKQLIHMYEVGGMFSKLAFNW